MYLFFLYLEKHKSIILGKCDHSIEVNFLLYDLLQGLDTRDRGTWKGTEGTESISTTFWSQFRSFNLQWIFPVIKKSPSYHTRGYTCLLR